MGTKNHSTFFPRTFLPNVYDVIRSDISQFVVSNNLPFGLLADKMITKHLTRHMVGVRIPVWDVRYASLNKDIYVQCSCLNDVTGKGIAKHMVDTLISLGIDRPYQRENLCGAAMDGQYVKLNVSDHLHDMFFKHYHLTWDPAHRIELSIKDCGSNPDEKQNFIESVSDAIQCIMKILSYGKPYMKLLHTTELSDQFITPKIFKSMKFVGHCSSVMKSFESNFKSIVSTLGSLDTIETIGLQDAILRVEFVLDYLLMKDIMVHLTSCSKLVQRSSTLPWTFQNSIYSLQQTLIACQNNLSVDNILTPNGLSVVLFPELSICYDVITKKEYKDCPLIDIPLSRVNTRSRAVVATSVEFLSTTIDKYTEYINKLIYTLEQRFSAGTFPSSGDLYSAIDLNPYTLLPNPK